MGWHADEPPFLMRDIPSSALDLEEPGLRQPFDCLNTS
ncbi:hypothetical protein APY04_1776 [Hyphomicrobium sulfonivorans]|uniref:Uncharacterized protein n=1 Tax=Hyphomicrobium sulfonivorans TaxID=121290 RepID=A0A120CW75_HYPSL|nr:hypothetical protein APY04_1776 [Hyphomicrobium sulfonivorans]